MKLFAQYKFAVELLVCASLFIAHLPKKNRFFERACIGILAVLFLSSFWNRGMAQNKVYSIIRYFVLFFSVTVFIWNAFECSFLIAVFCSMGAYAVQHLLHKIIWIITYLSHSLTDIGEVLVYFAIMVSGCCVIYFLFVRQISRYNYELLENKKNLLVCCMILVCTLVFNVFFSASYENTNRVIVLICSFYDCICCFMALLIMFGMFKSDRLKQEQEIVRQLHQKEMDQFSFMRDTMDVINMKCHDMRHQIADIISLNPAAGKEKLESIDDIIRVYDCTVETGNEVLDLVLTEKSLICHKEGIEIECMADGQQIHFMSDGDVYSLFANMIDNAIDAVKVLEEPEKKVIAITMCKKIGMVVINVENYYNGELKMEDRIPVTQKEDKRIHGYGMKSIQYLVEKYEGELSICTENNIFSLNIMFPDRN